MAVPDVKLVHQRNRDYTVRPSDIASRCGGCDNPGKPSLGRAGWDTIHKYIRVSIDDINATLAFSIASIGQVKLLTALIDPGYIEALEVGVHRNCCYELVVGQDLRGRYSEQGHC